ncbi:restriction endonuclease subunit S [Intestinibacter sp.]
MTFKISDICDINSNNLSTKDSYEFINYLDTSNLTEGVIDSLQRFIVGEDKIPSRAKRKVRKNDVLISTVRPNQKHYGILRRINENLIVSTGFTVLSAKEDIVYPEYLYRFLTQDSITNYLQAIGETSTSTYPSIKPSDIGSLQIELPSLEEQKAIAKVLSDLDEKIEINNKINKKLEEMAQAIFKQWFVDFEFPNEDGEPYKSSGGEMVESELGMIPKGWEVIEFSGIMNISSGKRPIEKSSNKTAEFLIPLAGASSIMGYVKEHNFKEPILVIGRVGTHGIVQRFNDKVWASDNTLVITSQYHEFSYQILNRVDYTALNRGSTQPLITQTDIKKQKIVKGTSNLLNEFERIVSDIFNSIYNNNKEIEQLVILRHILLPKLMSGEIRVPLD